MKFALATTWALCAACSRAQSDPHEQPAPATSVITLGIEVGGCPDIAVCERECEAGSADRCRRMAVSYALGEGAEKNETRATALYEHACEMDDPVACVFCQRPSGIDPSRPRRIDPPRRSGAGRAHAVSAVFSSLGSPRLPAVGMRSPGPRVTRTSAC